MLINAILTLHEEVADMPLGADREAAARSAEAAALRAMPTLEMKGLLR
jgi:NADH-quinone oxidoreductase subunit B